IGPAVFERSGGAISARTAGAGRSNTTSIARSAVLLECILFRPPSRSACSVTEYSFLQGCPGAIALFVWPPAKGPNAGFWSHIEDGQRLLLPSALSHRRVMGVCTGPDFIAQS